MPKSVYIHIPFCKHICAYCDFCKLYYNNDLATNYLNHLNKEIISNYKNEQISTIYVGGGTPSSLSIKQLDILFKTIKKRKFAKRYEFTFECNINDLNINLLKYLKNNKVNRLSIGIESFNKKILDNLGRKEYPNKEKILLAKKYFNNINIDLIYGANNETLNDLKNDLDLFLELNINHISIYSLIIEQNTILSINKYKSIDKDSERKMYDYIVKRLKENNFIHYEISNFAKKGYKSKHNLTYWHNNEYYGFGLGASGFVNNIRYTNTRNINKYLNDEYIFEKEIQTKKTNMENEMILALRLTNGISKKRFFKKYHKNISDVFDVKLLKENKTNFYIAKKDLYVENSILCDFIDI